MSTDPENAGVPKLHPAGVGLRGLAYTISGAALFVVLFDVAIEGALSRTLLGWVAATIVLVYSVVTAFLWRHISWRSKSIASFLILGALMLMTAWSPSGGLTIFGRSASTILMLATLLVVVLSGVIVFQIRFLSLGLRVAISTLAAYGALAFVIGIVTATPYHELFQGRSFWARLPFWLQCAFLAGVVLLPLTLLLHLLDGILFGRQHRRGRWASQAFALALGLMLAVGGTRGSSGTQLSLSPQERVGEAQKLFPAITRALNEIPRESFDPAALLQRIGRDSTKAFEWVRDETYWVPYQGVLRGGTGVLMDRVGNSLDRAILLHDLVRLLPSS